MGLKVLQLHKRPSYDYKYIQDKYAFSETTKCYAIADGTTQSFGSEFWADLITKAFVKNQTFEIPKLISMFSEFAKEFKNRKFDFSENPAKASLERAKQKEGATTTFIGIEIDRNNELSLASVGDSNAFLIRDNKIIGFPFKDINDLDKNKYFLNTEKLLSGEVKEVFFANCKCQLVSDDVIILATDALSRLILNNPAVCEELTRLSDFDQLHNFCLKYWGNRELEEDDITALIISDFNTSFVQKIIPPAEFSFPKEKEIEFIPSSEIQQNLNLINEQEMQQIINAINKASSDITELRNKSKSFEVLMMIAISLVCINIFLMFYLNPKYSRRNINEIKQQFENKLANKDSIIRSQEEKIRELRNSLSIKNTFISILQDTLRAQKRIDSIKMKQVMESDKSKISEEGKYPTDRAH